MATARKSVYIETTILSFLCADPSSIPVTFEKQRDTLLWWNNHRINYDLSISNEVVLEISRGDPEIAARRLKKAAELRLIGRVVQDLELAQEFLSRKLISPGAFVDATHLAIAVRTKMDFLLTWNLKHLANPQVLPFVYNFLKETGRHMSVIVTPAALMESL